MHLDWIWDDHKITYNRDKPEEGAVSAETP